MADKKLTSKEMDELKAQAEQRNIGAINMELRDLKEDEQRALETEKTLGQNYVESLEGQEAAESENPEASEAWQAAGGSQVNPHKGKMSENPLEGLYNSVLSEQVPSYDWAGSESDPINNSLRGNNNTWIILGRDRSMGWNSGYGGKGYTRAGAIDIVAGLEGFDADGNHLVDKNFGAGGYSKPGDAARIYISQCANIDDYFGLDKGSIGMSRGYSAIGMKADDVRIIARRGIKILTGQSPENLDSRGDKIDMIYGIDLIAGNKGPDEPSKSKDDALNPLIRARGRYLQPIPKGDNLEDCLESIIDVVLKTLAMLLDLTIRNMISLGALSISPIVGAAGPIPTTSFTTASPKITETIIQELSNVVPDLQLLLNEINAIKVDYLRSTGPMYINSAHNRTN